MTGNKKFLTLATTLIAAVGVGVGVVVINGVNNNASFFAKADLSYSVNFNSSNGAVSSEGQVLKTRSVVAKTNLNNDVSVYFKNAQNTAGKVGTIKAKGFYGNKNPIYDMANIRVTSNATESGDATLYYGPTSSYMPNSVALSAAASGVDVSSKSANYFKIVANKDVAVDSIEINFGCATKDFGPIGYNSTQPFNGYTFEFHDDQYYAVRNDNRTSQYKAMVPDYYNDGTNGEYPVTQLAVLSSYGVFEGASNLNEIHIPETITSFGSYLFASSGGSKVTEFTLPYALTSTASSPLPLASLETLNIHSVNLATVSSKVSGSSLPKLTAINVSYDVEHLPDLFSGFPTGASIYYEGTEAEWATLSNGTSWASFAGDVFCSDTEVANITFNYIGGTMGGVQNEQVFTKIVGTTIANPGTPVYDDGTKQFKGWFDAATGGNEIVFPMTVTEDTTIYAHFEDYGPGARFDNPINVVLGNSYSFTTDAQAPVGYFAYTATADAIIQMKLTAADASFSTINLRAFDNLGGRATIQTNYSASSAVAKYFSPDPDDGVGSFLRIRVANGETVYCGVDGMAYSSTYYGAFTVEFSEVTAAGDDYSTAIAVTNSATFTPANGKLTWYKFTPETTTDYYMTLTATTQWTGGSVGTVSGTTWTNVVATFNASAGTTKRAIQTLTAGTTYYFCINGRGGEVTLAVSDEVAESYSRSSATALTIDGEAIAITHDSDFTTRWYKFTVADTGKYRLTSSINITSSVFKLFKEGSDTEIAFSAGRTDKDKVYDFSGEGLGAATYYLSVVTTSGTSGLTINVGTVLPEAVVTVYANGPEKPSTSSETIDAGSTYVLADPTYVSNGHTYYDGFVGWFTDEELTVPFVSGTTVINANTNIYAKLTGKYTSDVLNAIDAGDANDVVNSMESYGAYPMYLDGTDFVSSNETKGSSSSGIKIEVKKNCQVSFDYTIDSEHNYDKIKVDVRATSSSSSVNKLTDSSDTNGEPKNGSFQYTLETGNVIEIYYSKDSSGDKGTDKLVIKNFTFTTVSNYTLSYNFGDERPNQEVEVISGAAITKIADPTRTGYRFDGWYTTDTFETPFNFAGGITEDTEIFAKWVETVTVTIYANGPDAASTETKVLDKGGSVSLSNLNGTYYHGFDGWYTDSALTQRVNEDGYGNITVNADTSFYAKKTKYSTDFADMLDGMYADMFTNVTSNNNAYNFVYDSTADTFTSGNHNVNSSESFFTVTLKYKTTVSFFYTAKGEGSSYNQFDYFGLDANGSNVFKAYDQTTEIEYTNTFEAGTVLKFYFKKDSSTSNEPDNVVIRQLRFTKFEA